MLLVDSILGNICDDILLQKEFEKADRDGLCERLRITRLETARLRLRRKTDKGTDIGLTLDHNRTLRHGDILLLSSPPSSRRRSNPKKFVLVEQLAEKVICVKIKYDTKKPSIRTNIILPNKKSKEDLMVGLVSIGHMLGNMHRPIAVDAKKNKIIFPTQDDSELIIFRKLLRDMKDHIDLTVEKQIFQPQYHGMEVHNIDNHSRQKL
jgi:urease accessory protein